MGKGGCGTAVDEGDEKEVVAVIVDRGNGREVEAYVVDERNVRVCG